MDKPSELPGSPVPIGPAINQLPVGPNVKLPDLSVGSCTGNYLTIFRPSAAPGGEKDADLQRLSTTATVQTRKYRKAFSHFDYGYSGGGPSRDVRKKEDRREKNRLAAKNCREEKQNYIRSLETRIAMLEARNRELISKLSGLKDIILELTRNQTSTLQDTSDYQQPGDMLFLDAQTGLIDHEAGTDHEVSYESDAASPSV